MPVDELLKDGAMSGQPDNAWPPPLDGIVSMSGTMPSWRCDENGKQYD